MKKTYHALSVLILLALLLSACAQQPAVSTSTTAPIAATQAATATTEVMPTTANPTATTELKPTEKPTDAQPTATMEPTTPPAPTYNEAPMLADQVKAGKLPPVADRLPVEPMVVTPVEGVGTYGGTLVTRLSAPGDWGDIWHATFPHLLWFDASVKEIVPDLAKVYKFNDDKTVLTIMLRKGLKWSDGAPFTADDLVSWWKDYKMNAAFNPNMEAPSQWAPGGKAMEVVKVDDYTVEYHFAVPYPMALNVITSWQGMQGQLFIPFHIIKKYHKDYNADADTAAKEIGYNSWQEAVDGIANLMWPGADVNGILPTLGMWRISSLNSTEINFERNPYYWAVDTAGNQLPYIDSVKAEIVPDNEVYNVNIMQGKYSYGKVASDKIELIKANEDKGNYNVLLYTGDIASNPVYAFNQNHKDPVLAKIFQDVRFRRAMSVAINRAQINDLVFDGYGTPTQATVHKTASFYDPKWSEAYAQYDPDMANQLLDEMGLDKRSPDGWRLRPDGKVLEFVINANDKATELVRDNWRAIGVKVEMNAIDPNLYWTRAAAGELDLGTWGLDNSVEFKVFQNVSKFWMGSGDLGYAVDWVKWHDTNGTQGVEPPADVKQYFADWDAIQSASGEEYLSLAKKIFNFYSDQVYLIGTVGYGLNAVYVSKDLHNVPQQLLFMDPTNWWLLARPDQWYFTSK